MKFLPIFLSAITPLALSLPLDIRQSPQLEAETDRLLFSVSLSEFLAARDARSPPGLDWSSDGCTSSPDNPFGFDFEPACLRHDFGYRNYKAQGRFEAGKAAIDRKFRADLYSQCAAEGARAVCEATAEVYYRAVVLFGREGAEAIMMANNLDVDTSDVRLSA
ncbi:hypothetical protein DL762_002190 [Monosporascus cannonballus]|uniref:Uncharacterized protein n=1 Tax=Monosporascus cannonballus TaxID=155416 RepID=A0ABY0HE78_9PEZI|nr:hypothetical protein DL763_007041 [Monosporascus cannonballus]RYO91464.1 hypothetical protein DL762_002190 [Monosporascus cannonballus]